MDDPEQDSAAIQPFLNRPIPPATRNRGERQQRAALLYIYGEEATGRRIVDLRELSEMVGYSEKALAFLKETDQWDKWLRTNFEAIRKAHLQHREAAHRGIRLAMDRILYIDAIDDDLKRQRELAAFCKGQQSRFTGAIEKAVPGSKEYGTLLRQLKDLHEMSGDASGSRVMRDLAKLSAAQSIKDQRPGTKSDIDPDQGIGDIDLPDHLDLE